MIGRNRERDINVITFTAYRRIDVLISQLTASRLDDNPKESRRLVELMWDDEEPTRM